MNEANQKRAHRAMAVALAVSALGMFITGLSRDDQMTPPGIYVLALVALGLYYTSRWAWVAIVGLLIVAAMAEDVFDTPAVSYAFHHPEFRGQLIGTIVKLTGLMVALVASVATLVIRIKRSLRQR